jgi:hypothetical protein
MAGDKQKVTEGASIRQTAAAPDDQPPEDPRPIADQAPVAPEPPKPGEVVRTDGGIDARSDILGGEIKETVNIPVTAPTKDRTRMQRLLIRAARAPGTAKLSVVSGRPLDTWGIVGEGDEVVGHFILVDLDTLDKIEVIDRYKVEGDHVYANAQNLPKALVAGDGLKQL